MNKIHETAIVYDNVILGDNIEIGPYCIIGSSPEMKSGYPLKNLGVIIGDDTIITGNATIDGGSDRPTTIGKNCFIMKSVHIGHDCYIEDDVIISPQAVFGGHSRICQYTNVGIGSIFHQYSLIGAGCMIGMGSVVTKKSIAKPFSKMVGSPSKTIGENLYVKNKLSEEDIDILNYDYKRISSKEKYLNVESDERD